MSSVKAVQNGVSIHQILSEHASMGCVGVLLGVGLTWMVGSYHSRIHQQEQILLTHSLGNFLLLVIVFCSLGLKALVLTFSPRFARVLPQNLLHQGVGIFLMLLWGCLTIGVCFSA
eukprot:c2869_g1_i2.p1 GENE.c2869_g1_i2~~c2869_g1_i2.p1  ORF type:complete len:116 (-),score=16.08 c2869_g1_i2:34-381(-)